MSNPDLALDQQSLNFDLKVNVSDTVTLLIKKYFTHAKDSKVVHSALDLMSLLYFT